MEPKRASYNSYTPTKDSQDIACKTGKHRVININPLLLTPMSASKLYPHSPKLSTSQKKLLPGSATKVEDDSANSMINSLVPYNSEFSSGIDVSDSELTDNTDIASVSELSNVSYEIKSVNDTKFRPLMSPQSSHDSTSHVGNSGSIQRNQPTIHGNPRRERTIQISPSLLLPVTAMPSHNAALPRSAAAVVVPKFLSQSDARAAISESSSMSDLRGSRLSINDDIDGLSTFSEAQDSVQTSCTEGMVNDYEKLKEALRLADADIAILVSSKQQLQLDLHKETARANTLSSRVAELEEKYRGARENEQDVKSTLSQKEEFFKSEMANMQGHLQHSTGEMELLRKSLEDSRSNEESRKTEIDLLKHLSTEQQVKLQRLEKEVSGTSDKNRELESLLRDATAKDEGIGSFVRHLTEVKNDVSARLQDKVMECEKLQIENKMLAAKCADTEHTNEHLLEKSAKHEMRFREADAENIMLQSRLSVQTREKVELNAAVEKLRGDLGKVENGFQKLKNQFLEKAATAHKETTRRVELEEEVKSLTADISKLNNVNAEIRIRDKNLQIEQLLTQSRSSSQEKSRLERSVKDLQDRVQSQEKSWVEMVEREKSLRRSLQDKDEVISRHGERIQELEGSWKNEREEVSKLKNSLQDYEKTAEDHAAAIRETEAELAQAVLKKQKLSQEIRELERVVAANAEEKKEIELRHHGRVDTLAQNNTELTKEIDRLQKSLITKQDEIGDRNSDEKSKEESNIEQLQLLSELQSARRELSQQVESLNRDKVDLRRSLEAAERTAEELRFMLSQQKESYESDIAKLNDSNIAIEDKYRDDIENITEKIRQSEEAKKLLGIELKQVKNQNQTLQEKINGLESDFERTRLESNAKNQQIEELKSRLKNGSEELGIIKQELSSTMVQLSDAISRNDNTDGKYIQEMNKLREESETLRAAVVRQQEYCVSLQKHYQDWAKEAEGKMRTEMAEANVKAEEYRKQAAEIAAKSIEKGVIVSCERSSQTDNDEIDGVKDATEQIEQMQRSNVLQERSDREIQILIEEKLQLLQENTQQAEMIAALESRAGISLGGTRATDDFASRTNARPAETLLEDAGTQTIDTTPTHELVVQRINSREEETLLDDATTQTSCLVKDVVKEIAEQTEKMDATRNEYENRILHLTKENAKLRDAVSQLELNLSDLKLSHSCMLEDSCAQTESGDAPLVSSKQKIADALLEDETTQTECENDTSLGSHEIDLLKDELAKSAVKVEELSKKLEDATSENLSLTSSLKAVRESSRSSPSENIPNSTENLQSNNTSTEKSTSENALPSPMTILQTMESKKLTAYKKTVAVLKKQLKNANKKIDELRAETKALLEHRSVDSKSESPKSGRDLERELCDVKKRTALQLQEAKRKALAERKILELRVSKMSERLDGLTGANGELRASVESLQVKLTERSRQTDVAVKEKTRYQMRARRLQASLRSLAWINGNQDKSMFMSDDFTLDDTLPESLVANSSLDAQEVHSETISDTKVLSLDSSKNSLPPSVVEIEASLKDLQSEIVALERQMQEHNSAVKKSKSQWTRLKQDSRDELPSVEQATDFIVNGEVV